MLCSIVANFGTRPLQTAGYNGARTVGIQQEYMAIRCIEPVVKFLLLPKVGLLGSLTRTKKNSIVNNELLVSFIFSFSHGIQSSHIEKFAISKF